MATLNARPTNKLSARFVENTASEGRYGDGGGLYLLINATGLKRWLFIYFMKGKVTKSGKPKQTEMVLGSAARGHISLAKARELAHEARGQISRGIDPMQLRQNVATPAVPTFGDMADEHILAMGSKWRNAKHRAQWTMTLTVHAAKLRNKPVNEITTTDVLAVLHPLWATLPETASRLRGRIENVLDAAKARGMRDGENPARWRGHLKMVLPKRERLSRGHHSALPYADMPAFIKQLCKRNSVAALALEFVIVTVGRTGEVLGATWSEIDTARAVWTVPAKRMKAGYEHRVPLSAAALVILAKMRALGAQPYVFPGQKFGKALSNTSMLMLLRRMERADITPHGFRSSFRNWAGEATDFPRELAEQALAHTIQNKAEAAYWHGDALEKRRAMMEAWAVHCGLPTEDTKPTAVTSSDE